MHSFTSPSATTSVERTTASEREVVIGPRITRERGPHRMSALLAKKGCAWLGQERHQASYAPRHSMQDAGGRTRLQSRRRARISAAIRLVSFFARFDVRGWARKKIEPKIKNQNIRRGARGGSTLIRHHSISRSQTTRTFETEPTRHCPTRDWEWDCPLCPGSSSTVPYRTGGPQGAGAVAAGRRECWEAGSRQARYCKAHASCWTGFECACSAGAGAAAPAVPRIVPSLGALGSISPMIFSTWSGQA